MNFLKLNTDKTTEIVDLDPTKSYFMFSCAEALGVEEADWLEEAPNYLIQLSDSRVFRVICATDDCASKYEDLEFEDSSGTGWYFGGPILFAKISRYKLSEVRPVEQDDVQALKAFIGVK